MVSSEEQYLISMQRLLDDPNFDEVVDRVRQHLFDQWRMSRSIDDREELYAQVMALESVVTAIKAAADNLAFESTNVRTIN
tara:strand:- start:232 stop:474 length:243 start_codon:yes stop_codon:yes gene_type:complete